MHDDTAVSSEALLNEARAAFDSHAWADAYVAFRAADAESVLDPTDLDRFATTAYLTGHDEESLAALARAHAGHLEQKDPIRAAASAFWLAFSIIDNPAQRAQAAGWLARARRLIEDAQVACAEEGWVLCATAYLRITERDLDGAAAAFAHAVEIGRRFESRDLLALARHGTGRCLLARGKAAEGLALLDEAMVSVTSGEVGPMVAGVVYCSVISACHDVFDLRRAQEWTDALQAWCASQPDLVPFRGYCLVRRSELLLLHGAWQEAMAEAQRACDRPGPGPRRPETGAAYYQVGEARRLRGDLSGAEDAYRLANQAGRKPYPGLALLRLAQGQVDAADGSIRLALQETRESRLRVPLLRAAVEIMLAKHDVEAAQKAAGELDQISSQLDSTFVRAIAAKAAADVALADGDANAAIGSLRVACDCWEALHAPFELARARTALGLACRLLGDREGAQLEFEAAQEAFERLGAAQEAARVAGLATQTAVPSATASAEGLTGREVEVLRLIATGATNRTIASRLGISEKTVARHVSNIFTKLDLTSRAGATAYAYEHKLI